ncbi:MAG: DoxX family protein [Pseudomonadota bacterium]|nr:DoxX family protein [Pseudomonadota bacterium]
MKSIINSIIDLLNKGRCFVSPMLALRLGVAWFFYKSALTKVTQVLPWPQVSDTTLSLFKDYYQVPLLDPVTAAHLGTYAELGLPLLLVAGLFTRFAALGLFVFNLVAYLSLPEPNTVAMIEHLVVYLFMILAIIVHGPGKVSLDHLLWRK